MSERLFFYGSVLLFIGIFNSLWPYKVAKLGEEIDAIGSKRSSSEVEPADWKIKLTRIIGLVSLFVGAASMAVAVNVS